ncbi:membrane dipeptidase [Thalassotalea nanhaiensis]|uniref:Membrane dipeptidase n=1 Tax=Thalassotalea nanhaiensis TaxID=3065648 RepID=A0ABY9TEB6_9GAMM|nr:membrane dipeptidase [Colwelliaceae bacterium SQ345]
MKNLQKNIIAIALSTAIATIAFAPTSAIAITDAEVAEKKAYLQKMTEARPGDERAADKAVHERYKDAIVIDQLVPGTPGGYVGQSTADWEAMAGKSRDNNIDFVSYTAAIDDTFDPLIIMDWIAQARIFWDKNSDKYQVVETVDDIRAAHKSGKFMVNINFQGSNALGGNLNMVETYYKLGVRSMNFAYNVRNHMSDGGGVASDRDGGLSKAGIRLVAEMNRVGMIVDCTHSSNRTCLDAAAASTKPIILSHSNAYGTYALPRNSPDDVIKAVAKTGGAICANGLGGFHNKQGFAGPEDLAKTINYVKELVGAKHTCWGSDYVDPIVYVNALDFVLRNPESFPPELGYGSPTEIAEPADVWGVVPVLEDKYGWTEQEIIGFLGENLMRVYKANWR